MFFFFKQKTAYEMRISDWSSDVCSSDLLALELFVIPGFGVAGILGIMCVVCGLAFSLVLNDNFNFSIAGGSLVNAFLLVLVSIVVTTVAAFVFGKNIFSKIGRASCRERVCQSV